jgi:hypothetical protein
MNFSTHPSSRPWAYYSFHEVCLGDLRSAGVAGLSQISFGSPKGWLRRSGQGQIVGKLRRIAPRL